MRKWPLSRCGASIPKPTFRVSEVSDGPHILQSSTPERAWVFQLHDLPCCVVAAELLGMQGIAKAGFDR